MRLVALAGPLRPGANVRPVKASVGAPCLLSAGFVLDWNNLLLDVERLRGQGNPPATRALAIIDAAVYDSVNAISPTHTVFHVDARAFPGASPRGSPSTAATSGRTTSPPSGWIARVAASPSPASTRPSGTPRTSFSSI
jgi:hypothetical protein